MAFDARSVEINHYIYKRLCKKVRRSMAFGAKHAMGSLLSPPCLQRRARCAEHNQTLAPAMGAWPLAFPAWLSGFVAANSEAAFAERIS